tara:strand:- start:315 stop:773 length:459 start_codon:yes stop_codon:yes gene_type:complete
MKKRNKKHNPVEAARKNNIRVLKGFAIAFIANDKSSKEPIKLINLKGDERPVTKTMSDAITVFRYKWTIYLVVGCFNSKGEQELKIDYAVMKQPYLQSELVGYLNERHQNFIGELKAKNVKMNFAGWIAKPSGRELEPEELYTIFDKLEAWQ